MLAGNEEHQIIPGQLCLKLSSSEFWDEPEA